MSPDENQPAGAAAPARQSTVGPSLSVVIPMHNEAENVGPLLGEVTAALHEDFELIVVDDGSSDATAAEVRRFAGEVRPVRLLRHDGCRGQSTAVFNGVRAASCELVVVLDGDMQNDPADIAMLLEAFRSDAAPDTLGMLIGHRVHRRDTWMRRIGSRVANLVRTRILNDSTPDTGCGLKVVRRSVFAELPYFDHMHRFLPALILRAGFRVVSLPVRHRERAHGASHYGTWDRLWIGIVDMAGVAWLARRTRSRQFIEE